MYVHGTPNYNLPLTDGNDVRDWADTNQAFTDVDAALHTASENASAAASGVSQLGTQLNTLSNKVDGIEQDVTDIDATVEQHGVAITGLGNKIDEVEDDALDMICAVDEGTAQIASVPVNEGDYFRYNNVLYVADDDIRIGDTIVPNTNCHATNVATELQSISPSGETVDSVARAGVALNNEKIGTLSQLDTENKSSLVAAINEVLSQIGGGGMLLDVANKVNIDSTTYTTLKDGKVVATFNLGDPRNSYDVTIDGESIAPINGGASINSCIVVELEIPAGSVIVTTGSKNEYHGCYFVPSV